MTVDAKPPKRIRNPKVLQEFHAANLRCLLCGDSSVEAHHILSRAQGGDDAHPNLIGLCSRDHGALHGNPYREEYGGKRITAVDVKRRIGNYILSEDGVLTALYLTAKLGVAGSRLFVEKLGVDV